MMLQQQVFKEEKKTIDLSGQGVDLTSKDLSGQKEHDCC